jgi:hypothetical protein
VPTVQGMTLACIRVNVIAIRCRDSSTCLLHSSERAIMIQLVATGGCSGVSDDQKKAT